MSGEDVRTVRIDCWCITCDAEIADAQEANGDFFGALSRPFVVCPDCGNKRCPKATHHDNACTGSNEPGQPGSVYVDWRKSRASAVRGGGEGADRG